MNALRQALPTLHQLTRKKREKFEQAAELALHYESTMKWYADEGWSVVDPDGPLEVHAEVPGVGKVTRMESHHPPLEASFRGFKSPLVHQKRVQHIGKPVENLKFFFQTVH